MARVLIAVPTFENITPDTFKAIYDMDKSNHECLFEFIRGYDTASARNNIVIKAHELCTDYVLMIDSDVTPKSDALVNLMSHNVDVVMGYYMHRSMKTNATTERTNACRLLNDDGIPYFNYPAESQMTVDELRSLRDNGEYLTQIHGGGMGCILIKTHVFDELRYPWYDWVNYADDNRGMLSEDLYFCEQCKNEGIPVYVDSRVSCGHLMRRIEYVE
jgi:hypothetical protein